MIIKEVKRDGHYVLSFAQPFWDGKGRKTILIREYNEFTFVHDPEESSYNLSVLLRAKILNLELDEFVKFFESVSYLYESRDWSKQTAPRILKFLKKLDNYPH